MHGVCFILGSGLAGSGVWADVPPVPIVTYFHCHDGVGQFPEDFSACVVTRAGVAGSIFK